MTKPTNQQIEQIAAEMVASLGNAVNLQGNELALCVDCKFYGMTDDEFAIVRAQCVEIANSMRAEAIRAMWA